MGFGFSKIFGQKNNSTDKKQLSGKQQQYVNLVMEKTGWDEETAISKMTAVQDRFGLGFATYEKYCFYQLSDKELEEKAISLKRISDNKRDNLAKIMEDEQCGKEEARELLKTMRRRAIRYTMREKGIGEQEAIEVMEEAVSRLGISYHEYRRFRLGRIKIDEQKAEYDRRIASDQSNSELFQQRVQTVMDRTGMSEEEVHQRLEDDKGKYKCSDVEWFFYNFYELTDEEKQSLFLHYMYRRLRRIYPYDEKQLKILESKELQNAYFKDYIKRPWCVPTDISLDDFKTMFKDSKGVVYKPQFGLMGRDVQAFFFDETPIDEIYASLKSRPQGIVEELVIQHPVLNQLNPSSVNTIRIVTVSSFSKPVTPDGKNVEIAFATLKIGGGDSIVDNLHANGLCAAVDLESGKLITDGVDNEGDAHQEHPFTHAKIKGFQLPFVNEAVELVLDAVNKLKLEGIIGWDIAFGENGPLVIEPNAKPDPILGNGPFGPEHKGIRKELEDKFLWEE